MSRHVREGRRLRSRGATLVEFSLSAFLMIVVLLSVVEMGRMMLVLTTVTNAARAAARYAIVHGSNRTGTGVNGPSGPGANPPQVVAVATNYAEAGLIDAGRLTVNVTYPNGANTVGSPVVVSLSYAYNPMLGMLRLGVPLRNVSRGIIAF